MLVNGKQYRTIWPSTDDSSISIIDQRKIPFAFEIEKAKSYKEMCIAIKDMHIRGAGLIGAAAGYGMYLAALESVDWGFLQKAASDLIATRPTAVNLAYAVNKIMDNLAVLPEGDRLQKA